MSITDIFGFIGGMLLLIKIGIHIYIARSIDKKFPLGSLGPFINLVFFLPITENVDRGQRTLKKIGNVIYVTSLLLIVIFLIGTGFKKPDD